MRADNVVCMYFSLRRKSKMSCPTFVDFFIRSGYYSESARRKNDLRTPRNWAQMIWKLLLFFKKKTVSHLKYCLVLASLLSPPFPCLVLASQRHCSVLWKSLSSSEKKSTPPHSSFLPKSLANEANQSGYSSSSSYSTLAYVQEEERDNVSEFLPCFWD